MGRRECLYEALQLGMIEFPRCSGASIPPRMKFEDAVYTSRGMKPNSSVALHTKIFTAWHTLSTGASG